MRVESKGAEETQSIASGHDKTEEGLHVPELLHAKWMQAEVRLELPNPIFAIRPAIGDVPTLIEGQLQVGHIHSEMAVRKFLKEQLARQPGAHEEVVR